MRVIIMGCGRVGSELSNALLEGGNEVAIIDKNPEAFHAYPPGEGARQIVGLGFDRDVLEDAGIKEADAFVAVSSGDNSNIVSARVALENYHVPRVIARIYDSRRAEIYERLNIPTVATTRWGVKQIQLMLFHDREEIRETLGGGDLLRLRVPIPEALAGSPLSHFEVEGKVLVAGVSRGGGGFLPKKDSTVQAGDYLILMVTGGGAVGRHLASDLTDRGHDVTLIEQRRDLAEKLSRWAPDTRIVYGDACEPRILEDADMRSADVVVAATGDDEDNLVTSLLAKQEFGVPRVLARVNHPKNEWLFDEQWGVDASVSPPHILTAMVEEAVTVGDLVRLLRLEGGRVALVEMRLPSDSANVGKALYELRLPPDATLVAILREGHVMIPQPETVLAAGDEVVALSSAESEPALRDSVMGAGEGSDDQAPAEETA
jgi:trk system potassium uptake protein